MNNENYKEISNEIKIFIINKIKKHNKSVKEIKDDGDIAKSLKNGMKYRDDDKEKIRLIYEIAEVNLIDYFNKNVGLKKPIEKYKVALKKLSNKLYYKYLKQNSK